VRVLERLASADRLIDIGRIDDATALVRAVLAEAPQDVRALCTLARCHDLAGAHAHTLAVADAAIAADPDSEWAYRLRSMALRKLGRPVESVPAAQRAVALDPQWWGGHRALALALVAGGRIPEAYRAARRVRALAPQRPETFYLFTDVYEAAGEVGAARREYLAGLAVAPADPWLLGGLAYLDRIVRRDGAAARRYVALLAANPAVDWYRVHCRQAIVTMQRRWGLVGLLIALPFLFTWKPGHAPAARTLLALLATAGWVALVVRAHRGLGRVWRAEALRFEPSFGLVLPALMLAAVGPFAAVVHWGVVTILCLLALSTYGPAAVLVGADLRELGGRARRRTAFRTAIGGPPPDPRNAVE
jgi:tetratricopeptide (TPR) repeat protein